MKTHAGAGVELHVFLTSVLNEVSGPFYNPAALPLAREPPVIRVIIHEAKWTPEQN
jgi:hypothetical protein